MPTEDDGAEREGVRAGRQEGGGRKGGRVSAGEARQLRRGDREPGEARLAAVEPERKLTGCCCCYRCFCCCCCSWWEARHSYNGVPGSYHRTDEKGVWHRPAATDTNARPRLWLSSASSGGRLPGSLIQVLPYGSATVDLQRNADSLPKY